MYICMYSFFNDKCFDNKDERSATKLATKCVYVCIYVQVCTCVMYVCIWRRSVHQKPYWPITLMAKWL